MVITISHNRDFEHLRFGQYDISVANETHLLLHYSYIRPLIQRSLLIAYRLNDSSRTNSDTSRGLGFVLYDFSTSTLPSGFSNKASQLPGKDRKTNPLDILFKLYTSSKPLRLPRSYDVEKALFITTKGQLGCPCAETNLSHVSSPPGLMAMIASLFLPLKWENNEISRRFFHKYLFKNDNKNKSKHSAISLIFTHHIFLPLARLAILLLRITSLWSINYFPLNPLLTLPRNGCNIVILVRIVNQQIFALCSLILLDFVFVAL